MNTVFVDTSFYVAMLSPTDRFHASALEWVRSYAGRTVTTEQVLTETGNWFAACGDRGPFVALLESIRADPKATVIWSDRGIFDAAIALYAARRDKEWSLTDCFSFVVMKKDGLTEALTADHHFEQAGFKALLK